MGVKNINKSAFMPDLNILLPIVCTFRKELEKSWRLTSYMQNCHCLTVIITSTFITPNPVTVSESDPLCNRMP